jgi:hypothetical protein
MIGKRSLQFESLGRISQQPQIDLRRRRRNDRHCLRMNWGGDGIRFAGGRVDARPAASRMLDAAQRPPRGRCGLLGKHPPQPPRHRALAKRSCKTIGGRSSAPTGQFSASTFVLIDRALPVSTNLRLNACPPTSASTTARVENPRRRGVFLEDDGLVGAARRTARFGTGA